MHFLQKTAILLAASLALSMPLATAGAQGYPGLSGGNTDVSPPSGYGGLTSPSTPRAAVRPETANSNDIKPTEGQKAAQESLTNAETQSRLNTARQNNIQQTLQTGGTAQPAFQNAEDLKMAAAIQENVRLNRPSVLNPIRLSDKMLQVINRPREKVNGMWPQEAQALQYVNAVFRDIRNAPQNEKRAKITAARQQINGMIDANLVTLAAPDEVSINMGIAPAIVAQRKEAAAAANEKLNTALGKLR